MKCNANSLTLLNAHPYYQNQNENIHNIVDNYDIDWLDLHSYDGTQYFWHYTDLNGLKGIVENRNLWFGHLKTMNDPNEFNYSIQLIKSAMEVKKNEYPDETVNVLFKRILEFVEGFGNGSNANWFIACFSEARDQLSQWRAYSKDGVGVSLGFQFSNMTELSDDIYSNAIKAQKYIRKVIYDKEKQQVLIDQLLSAICKEISEQKKLYSDKGIIAAMALPISNLLMDFAVSFKDSAFSEEKEWRFIRVLSKEQMVPKALFNTSAGKINPILPTQFVDNPFESDGGARFPLRSIQLGPQMNADISKPFIESFVSKEKSKNHPIHLYDIEIIPPSFAYRTK